MEGYIKSLSVNWRHIFKRSVRPGGKIPLDELYDTYGKKYDLAPNDEFIEWLKDVKLKGLADTWQVVLIDDKISETVRNSKVEKVKTGIVKKELDVEAVVNLPVRKAREILPEIMDLSLLKYALQEAKPRANKDSLCRLLEKRISEISVLSRS
jgi:hypothetical protein